MIFSCNSPDYFSRKMQCSYGEKLIELLDCNSPVCYFDAIMRKNNLVDINSIDPSILVELKYATTDNFMGMNLYGCLCKAYFLPEVANRLVQCQKYLKELHPQYSIIVYDAARPLQIQQIMWDSLDLPVYEKIKFLSNPAFGSVHNYGAAVDVSIIGADGLPLDMGTPFDFIGEEAHPQLEWQMLQEEQLTTEQIENRQLLRQVMRKGGFWGIQTEWWHFNAMTREAAAQNYSLIR